MVAPGCTRRDPVRLARRGRRAGGEGHGGRARGPVRRACGPGAGQRPGFPARGQEVHRRHDQRRRLRLHRPGHVHPCGRLSPSVYEFGQGWAVNQFNASVIDAAARQGMLPLISWNHGTTMETPGANGQSDGSLQLAHDHRRPLRPLHQVVGGGRQALGYPIALRFAHEMNGNWYPGHVRQRQRPQPVRPGVAARA